MVEKATLNEKKKKRRVKPIFVGLIIASVIGYLIYTGIRDTGAYYLTVTELLAKSPALLSEKVRVGGNVSPDSVKWDPKDLKLSFKIEDGTSSLMVSYQGVLPDSFKPGREVIVEGKYTGDGQLIASTIMPKCASKYE